jgi:SAM-dependent methyltransferase
MIIKIPNTLKRILDILGLKSLLKSIYLKILPYTPTQVSVEEWDSQYSLGRWDYLKQIGELARYSVIAGYCHFLKEGGKILDLGCGEGILQERLCYTRYSRYVGVDISAEASSKTFSRDREKTLFVQADISDYNPNGRFDIVIFNECLYYLKDPLGAVNRYASFLEEGGLLIVSMSVTENNNHIWKMIEKSYDIMDEVLVVNKTARLSWVIKVFTNSSRNGWNLGDWNG